MAGACYVGCKSGSGVGSELLNGCVDDNQELQTIPADFRSFDPSRDLLWPIPQKEIDLNPELGQNPGY